ncbi:MAG: adenylate kinase [Pelagibacteraceae bacterium]|nr:adenylate kinase [Pelagibacteraceae bacterium]
MNVIIFGPPGAGKGTQSSFLVEKKKMFQLSTGDLLRNELKSKSKLSEKLKKIMDSGKLVSDDIINSLIEKKISDSSIKSSIIFDGFPRNIEQAKSLDTMLKKYEQKISVVINLVVDNSILVKRISGRISCSVCKKPFNEFFDPPGDPAECTTAACIDRELIKRSDDNENTVSNRLRTYEESTLPLLEYYKLKGVVKNVDAMKSINEVTSQINCIFNDL